MKKQLKFYRPSIFEFVCIFLFLTACPFKKDKNLKEQIDGGETTAPPSSSSQDRTQDFTSETLDTNASDGEGVSDTSSQTAQLTDSEEEDPTLTEISDTEENLADSCTKEEDKIKCNITLTQQKMRLDPNDLKNLKDAQKQLVKNLSPQEIEVNYKGAILFPQTFSFEKNQEDQCPENVSSFEIHASSQMEGTSTIPGKGKSKTTATFTRKVGGKFKPIQINLKAEKSGLCNFTIRAIYPQGDNLLTLEESNSSKEIPLPQKTTSQMEAHLINDQIKDQITTYAKSVYKDQILEANEKCNTLYTNCMESNKQSNQQQQTTEKKDCDAEIDNQFCFVSTL